jgi:hypothetical protein
MPTLSLSPIATADRRSYTGHPVPVHVGTARAACSAADRLFGAVTGDHETVSDARLDNQLTIRRADAGDVDGVADLAGELARSSYVIDATVGSTPCQRQMSALLRLRGAKTIGWPVSHVRSRLRSGTMVIDGRLDAAVLLLQRDHRTNLRR